ncbi:unnamed protein product [Paramecium sonneborni]|uniref:Uncharacterized protein n=1 Tax=Paramecium sonneborni TaxID=65129 RepID=A0A8S1LGM2_9CILI|nr:unnamed protein product [Paramecium sonneborni]
MKCEISLVSNVEAFALLSKSYEQLWIGNENIYYVNVYTEVEVEKKKKKKNIAKPKKETLKSIDGKGQVQRQHKQYRQYTLL